VIKGANPNFEGRFLICFAAGMGEQALINGKGSSVTTAAMLQHFLSVEGEIDLMQCLMQLSANPKLNFLFRGNIGLKVLTNVKKNEEECDAKMAGLSL